MNRVSKTAQALFNCLQRSNDIINICDDMCMSHRVLIDSLQQSDNTEHQHIAQKLAENDIEKTAAFMQNAFAKNLEVFGNKSLELATKKRQAFINVFHPFLFGAGYDDVEALYQQLYQAEFELEQASELCAKAKPKRTRKKPQMELVA